jgi:signal transduction histidine kinase
MDLKPLDEMRLHRILLVDDREENLFALENMLMEDDRVFFKAFNGKEALKIAFKEELSLILLDVQMPEMDGFEVAQLLKSTARTKKIPIVFVSAISKETKYVVKGLEGGAVDYLFKPLDIEVTRAKVNTLLQFYKQQLELELKNAELELLNDQKNYFLGIAAHDLRSPLGNIQTFSDFLLNEANANLSDQHKEFLHIIKNSSSFMLELVNNLLDVSKIESGKLDLQLEVTNMVELITNNINLNKNISKKKNIEIKFLPADELVEAMVDKTQIEQVLNNLITNAIKFSNKDTVIEISMERNEKALVLCVKDQGQGIPKQELEKLFTPFHKTSVKSTAGEKSTGLGLAIAKKIVEAHKGKIWVISEVGKGSEFRFSLS